MDILRPNVLMQFKMVLNVITNVSIKTIVWILTGVTIPLQSGPKNNGNKEVALHFP